MFQVLAYLDLRCRHQDRTVVSYLPIGVDGNPVTPCDYSRDDGRPLAETQSGDIINRRGQPMQVTHCQVAERSAKSVL